MNELEKDYSSSSGYSTAALSLVKITNPFNRLERQIEAIPFSGGTLEDIVKPLIPQDMQVCVSLNGHVVPVDKLSGIIPASGDQIVVLPVPAGGGGDSGKTALRAISMIVLAVASVFTAGGTLALMGVTELAAATLGELSVAALAAAVVSVGGGLLINSLLPPTGMLQKENNTELSQGFGWNPKTRQRQGLSVPYVYGKNLLTGNVVSVHSDPTRTDNKQALNIKLALGFGPFSSIDNIQINDQPLEYYSDITVDTRLGYLDQEVIPEFTDTKVEYAINYKLQGKDSEGLHPHIYETETSDFDSLEIDLAAPNGLYRYTDDGRVFPKGVRVRIEFRPKAEYGESEYEWQHLSSGLEAEIKSVRKVTALKMSDFNMDDWWVFDCGHDHTESDIGKLEAYTKRMHNLGFGTACFDGFTGAGISALNGTEHEIKILDYDAFLVKDVMYDSVKPTDNGAGGVVYNKDILVQDKRRSNVVRTVTIPKEQITVPDHKYEIRVTRLNAERPANETSYMDDLYLGTVREVTQLAFSHPRVALASIRAIATDELSGSFEFSCVVEGRCLRVFDGSDWGITYSDNPAWILYDILTQPVFSGSASYLPGSDPMPADPLTVVRYDGIDPSRIDIAAFYELAQFCDEVLSDGTKRSTFNGVFDSETSMWEAALKICEISRCSLVWNGMRLTVAIDRPTTPSQLFSVDNIIADTFKQVYLPEEDRASEIEVHYRDEDEDYQRTIFSLVDPEINNPSNKITLELFGITKPAQAWRAAQFRLKQNRLLKKTIQFEADIDALACTVGDVVLVQHDVPQWGTAGKVVSQNVDNIVSVDGSLQWSEGQSHVAIFKRAENDEIIVRDVNSINGQDIILSAELTEHLSEGDMYLFGVNTNVTNPFRVISISRSSDQTVQINAIEYNEEIYNFEQDDPEIPSVGDPTGILPDVADLSAAEISQLDSSGNIVRNIEVTWSRPAYGILNRVEIWQRDINENQWELVQTVSGTSATISDALGASTYEIAAVSVDAFNRKTPLLSAPSVYITTGSDSDFWADTLNERVTGLQLYGGGNATEFSGKDAKFVWNDISGTSHTTTAGTETGGAGDVISNTWLKDYEVSVYDTEGNIRRREYISYPAFTYGIEKNAEDGGGVPVRGFTIEVKARNVYGRVSRYPARLRVSNPQPAAPGGIAVSAFALGWRAVWEPVSDNDLAGYCVWASQTDGFTPSASNLVAQGLFTVNEYSPPSLGTWYVRVGTYDAFGADDMNYSGQVAVTVSEIGTDDIADNAVTVGKLNVSQLSAISADMGDITSGSITLDLADGTDNKLKIDENGIQTSTDNGGSYRDFLKLSDGKLVVSFDGYNTGDEIVDVKGLFALEDSRIGGGESEYAEADISPAYGPRVPVGPEFEVSAAAGVSDTPIFNSGWFKVERGNKYSLPHNLGTEDLEVTIRVAPSDANGDVDETKASNQTGYVATGVEVGVLAQNITKTQMDVIAGADNCGMYYSDIGEAVRYNTGWCKVICRRHRIELAAQNTNIRMDMAALWAKDDSSYIDRVRFQLCKKQVQTNYTVIQAMATASLFIVQLDSADVDDFRTGDDVYIHGYTGDLAPYNNMTMTVAICTQASVWLTNPLGLEGTDTTGMVDRQTWNENWNGSDHQWEYTGENIQDFWRVFTATETLDTTGTFRFLAQGAGTGVGTTDNAYLKFRVNANVSGYRNVQLIKK